MHSFPVGSVMLIVFVDIAVIEMLSAFIGLLVAGAANQPVLKGLLLGILVPILGPVIWMVVTVARDASLASISRTQPRGMAPYAASGFLALSALLFLIAIPIPWGSADGSIQGYSLVSESSAADTGVGLLAMVSTAAVLVTGLVGVLVFAVRRRVAIVAAMVGAAWLVVTVDGLIVFSSAAQLSRTLDGLSGGMAAASAAPGGGLYVSLVASLAAIAGAIVLALTGAGRPAAAWALPLHHPSDMIQTSPYAQSAPPVPPLRDEF